MLQRNGNIGGMWLVRECAVVQLYFVSCIPYFWPTRLGDGVCESVRAVGARDGVEDKVVAVRASGPASE